MYNEVIDMDWSISPELQALISPEVARIHGVVPLSVDGARLRLLDGTSTTEADLKKKERRLQFILGRAVELQLYEDHPIVGYGFAEILDNYYHTESPEWTSEPVATDLITVLLVADKGMERE